MFRKNKLLSREEISAFCQQVNMVVKADLPIYYGISILRDEAVSESSRDLFNSIYEPMEKGSTLYDAISATGVFPDYMLQMVHVGEQTGRLEEVLDSLSVYYEREAEIRSGIRHAVTYPLIMSVMMLAVIVVIITKVVPIFSDVYAELGSGLTGSAWLLMQISSFLNQYLLIFLIGFVLLVLLTIIFIKTPAGKKIIERRSLACSLASSRIANCMYLALASGLDSNQGLSLAEALVDNGYMEERLRHCRSLVAEGESFAKSLLLSGVFSKMYSSIITIGYKTSAMDDVMLSISKAYEQETDEKLRHFVAILEPTLIIILSFFIGLILVSFLLPLLGIMSSIG